MSTPTATIQDLEKEIMELKGKVRDLRKETPAEPVEDYEFVTASGTVRLSELFGDKDELLILHNMGKECSYCTLWADGINGFIPHILTRASFVMVNPNSPEVQAKVAASRGWNYKIVQDAEHRFSKDMNMFKDGEGFWPGMSAFVRDKEGKIYRKNYTYLGPGDDFCGIWFMWDLFGAETEWHPEPVKI